MPGLQEYLSYIAQLQEDGELSRDKLSLAAEDRNGGRNPLKLPEFPKFCIGDDASTSFSFLVGRVFFSENILTFSRFVLGVKFYCSCLLYRLLSDDTKCYKRCSIHNLLHCVTRSVD